MSEFKAILEPIAELLGKKNHDYGDSYTVLRDIYKQLVRQNIVFKYAHSCRECGECKKERMVK